MKKKYEMLSNSLIFANGESVAFEFPVKELLQVHDVIIVITDEPVNKSTHKNVFAFNTSGDFLWRIEEVRFFYTGTNDCSYIGVEINGEGEVILFNWCDTAVVIDHHTGQVIRTFVTR